MPLLVREKSNVQLLAFHALRLSLSLQVIDDARIPILSVTTGSHVLVPWCRVEHYPYRLLVKRTSKRL